MDMPRLPSPPSIYIREHVSNHERRCSTSRSHFASGSMSSPHSGLPIPNGRPEEAPPPLPPPRIIDDLANGQDQGWKWGNRESENERSRPALAPIKPGSSLFGGYHAGGTGGSMRSEWGENQYEHNKDAIRAGAVSTIRSPAEPEIKVEGFGSSIPSTRKSAANNAEATNHRLHGERLAQQSLEYSSNAYDKHLLSRIGKPNSPPRQSSLGSIPESALPKTEKGFGGEGTRLKSFSLTDAQSDSSSRWIGSPSSAAVSPGPRTGYRDYVGYRSPSVDSNAPSSALDTDYYSRLRDGRRGSISNSLPGTDESASLPSRSNRGSYDQSFTGEPETDFPMEETGAFRQLNIGDRTPPRGDRQSLIKQGLKRRASSPPREPLRDEKVPAQSSPYTHDYHHRPSTGHYFPRSPNSRFHPNHGSVSSTASSVGLRNGSYASSAGLSLGGSSMTSMSSYGRHSPRAVSPTSDLDTAAAQDSPYISSVSLNPSSGASLAGSRTTQHPALSDNKGAIPPRKMSGQIPVSLPARSGVQRIGGLFICECCPKKPKKFESAEDLGKHQMEKQYSCQYCNNRFKNKNEAERHQNSLHLRRHSWSCAAIAGYEAAFHPSTSAAAQTHNGPASDTCGYCGEEFTNFPQRDWERRFDHLTNVHKFAECNQSKKFFRADHFRQHLKHSHAGTSGKWTNMLENACMREELPADMPSSLISSSGGPGPGSTSAGYGSGVMGNTIDERHDES